MRECACSYLKWSNFFFSFGIDRPDALSVAASHFILSNNKIASSIKSHHQYLDLDYHRLDRMFWEETKKKWLDIITKIKNKSQAQINHHCRRRPTKPFCMNGISMVFKRMIMIYILNSSRKKLSNNKETKKKSLTLEIAARNGNKNAINYTPIKITSCHIHNRCEIHLPPQFASLTRLGLAYIALSSSFTVSNWLDINAIFACTYNECLVCDYAIKLIDCIAFSNNNTKHKSSRDTIHLLF